MWVEMNAWMLQSGYNADTQGEAQEYLTLPKWGSCNNEKLGHPGTNGGTSRSLPLFWTTVEPMPLISKQQDNLSLIHI